MTIITGTADTDTLTGTDGDDTIDGLAGNDLIHGGAGNDVIQGGAGIDTLFGDDGNDILDSGANLPIGVGSPSHLEIYGDAGGNKLYGGNGDDQLTGGRGDTLDGGSGDDVIMVLGDVLNIGSGPVTVTGGDGNDTITVSTEISGTVDAGAGNDVINLFVRTDNTSPAGSHLTVTTGAGADEVNIPLGGVSLGLTPPARVYISDFTVSGSEHDSVGLIGGGNPFAQPATTVFQPYLLGQSGGDAVLFQMQSQSGGDPVYLVLQGVDAHTLTAANFGGYDPGPVWTVGTSGGDTLTASDAGDHLAGLLGDDTLIGGAGDDVLVGGAGADTLTGGAGADTFVYYPPNNGVLDSTAAAPDLITDFQTGIDKIDVSAVGATTITLSASGGMTILDLTTARGVMEIDVKGAVALSDLITSVTLTGTSGYDHLIGSGGGDTITGGGGGDTLTGGAGADTFVYAAASDSTASGYDIITDFQHGSDLLDLTAVAPTAISLIHDQDATYLFATTPGGSMEIAAVGDVEGTDLLTGAPVPLYEVADDKGDALVGGSANDTLVGGAGADSIEGGPGADILYGGAGADSFIFRAMDSTPQAYDIVEDFETGIDKIELALSPTNVSLVHYNGGTFIFGLGTNNDGSDGGAFQIASVHDVNGSDLVGLTAGVYMVADDNGDALIGSEFGDTIVGGAGHDVITGGGGADALYGGAGADTFRYLAPSDSTPQAYDIIQDFATGTDKLDLTALTPTNVSILHYNGGTFINGVGTNNAVFQIASIHDINAPDIIGLTSGAYIVGDTLGDTLIGASFAETIVGGTGNDVIIGGGGADALYGGGGANMFKYLNAGDSTVAAPDIIHDFVSGTDKIDLTAVHAGSASASYGLAFTATGSYLFVDTNGDGANDMLIELTNPNLHATDILW